MKHLIAPSILSCDFAHVGRDVEMISNSGADWIHVDVMDGVYVPNLSFGLPVVEAMKRHSSIPLDVHLMIDRPERYITDFRNSGADTITIHPEACVHFHAAIQSIKKTGAKAGAAINPGTPISMLEDVIMDLDLVCIMSVNPGWGGQKFIPQALKKIQKLRTLIKESNSNTLIEVDGGIKLENGQSVLDAGADVLVSGSGVFGQPDPVAAIQQFKAMRSYTA